MQVMARHGVAEPTFDVLGQLVEVARTDRIGLATLDAPDVVIVSFVELVAGCAVAELDATDDADALQGFDVAVDRGQVVGVVVVQGVDVPRELLDRQRDADVSEDGQQTLPTAGHPQARRPQPAGP